MLKTAESARDRCPANQVPRELRVNERLLFGRKGVYRSCRRCAIGIDQFPVEAAGPLDDLEVCGSPKFIVGHCPCTIDGRQRLP